MTPTARTMNLELFISGIPRPGGSKRAFIARRKGGAFVTRPDGSPVVNMTDMSGKAGKTWRSDCKAFAMSAMAGRPLFTGPLHLTVAFYMPRPQKHYRTGKHAGELRDDAPYYHTSKPDVTKLLRSLEDALTGVCWADDSTIAWQKAMKVYCHDGVTGARVEIKALEDSDGPKP